MDLRNEAVALGKGLPKETEDKMQQGGSRKGSEFDVSVAPLSFEVMLALSHGVAVLANILSSISGDPKALIPRKKFDEALSALSRQAAVLQNALTPSKGKETNPSIPFPEEEKSPREKRVGSPSAAVVESGLDVYVSEDGYYVVRKIGSDCYSVHKDGAELYYPEWKFNQLREWHLPIDLVEKIWRAEKVEVRDLGEDIYNVCRDGTLWYEDLRLLDLRISILPPFLLEEVWGKGHPQCDFEEIEQYMAELSKASDSNCRKTGKLVRLFRGAESLRHNKVVQAVAEFAVDEYKLKRHTNLSFFAISSLSLHKISSGFEFKLIIETMDRFISLLAVYRATVHLSSSEPAALLKFEPDTRTRAMKRKRDATYDYKKDIYELREN